MKKLPKVGLRTIKSAIAVFLSMLIFSSEAFFACSTAIICLQNTISDSIETGKQRIIGTLLGGGIGGVFLVFIQWVDRHNWLNIGSFLVHTIIALGIMATIYLCAALNISDVISLATTVFLAITTTHAYENPMKYATNRLFETICGILIAVLVNKYCNFGRRKKNDIL